VRAVRKPTGWYSTKSWVSAYIKTKRPIGPRS